MEEGVILSVRETKSGLEIKIDEDAYGNLALVGVLEKIKLTIITEQSPIKTDTKNSYLDYDA